MDLPLADQLLYAYVAGRASHEPEPFVPASLPQMQRVLLVLTTGLGDAILSTPVFPSLRRALPQADIRLFCRAAWAPLFRSDPDLNGVIVYHGKYRRFFPTIKALREFSPDLTVILHGNDPDILPLAYLARSRFIVRVPTRGTRYQFLLANRLRSEDATTLPGIHYVENRLRVLDTLGIQPATVTPRIVLDSGMLASASSRIRVRVGGSPYWVLHQFAADAYKVWPLKKAREMLIAARKAHPAHQVVLTGTGSERTDLQRLASGIGGVHVVAGDFDVCETACILAGSTCVVAPDTGMLHLAAALDRPVIGLYAPTYSELVGPRAPSARSIAIQKSRTCDPCVEKKCPYTPLNCMNQIGEIEVLAALAKQLS